MEHVTLLQVAERAGVSKATASKVLNGRWGVSRDAQERVFAAAEQLRFRPNAAARSLATGRSEFVGIVTSDLEGRFVLPVMLGVDHALSRDTDSSVILCNAGGDPERERHYVSTLVARRIDGIIVVGDRTDPRPPLDPAPRVPTVYVYAPSTDPADVSFVPDDVQAGRLAVEHLVDQGCTKIVHVPGYPGWAATRDRERGVIEALHAAGLEPVEVRVPENGGWIEKTGRAAVADLVERDVDFDGIVCASDSVARGALEALLQQEIRVPEQVKLVGFDNSEAAACRTEPEITSVDLQLDQLGEAAVAELITRIETGQVEPGVHRLPCRLEPRGSSR